MIWFPWTNTVRTCNFIKIFSNFIPLLAIKLEMNGIVWGILKEKFQNTWLRNTCAGWVNPIALNCVLGEPICSIPRFMLDEIILIFNEYINLVRTRWNCARSAGKFSFNTIPISPCRIQISSVPQSIIRTFSKNLHVIRTPRTCWYARSALKIIHFLPDWIFSLILL